MIRFACLFTVIAGPAMAQEPAFDVTLTEVCVAETTDMLEKQACIGKSATQCLLDLPEGITTPGMVACHGIEAAYWEARLDAVHASLTERLAERDAMDAPGATPELPIFEAQHAAWAAYRDADCAFLLSQSGEVGEGADFVTVTCRMEHTADQAVTLEEMDRDF